MVPSGPFAMGPLAAGDAALSRPSAFLRGSQSQAGFGKDTTGSGTVKSEHATAPLPRNRDQVAAEDEPEMYSEEETGLAIVDLEDMKLLDAMAPDTLKRVKQRGKGEAKVGSEAADDEVKTSSAQGEPPAAAAACEAPCAEKARNT